MTSNNRLKIIRDQLGLTQEALGKMLGLNRLNITNLESGKVKISTLHALAIEHVLNVNKEWLLYGKGNPFIDRPETPAETAEITRAGVERQDLIKRFRKPEIAKEINEDLIELEELDDPLYIDVAKHIKSSVNAARVIKGSKKTPK